MKPIDMAFKKNEFLDPILEMLIQNSSEAGPRMRPRAHLSLPDVYDSQARYPAPSNSRTGKLISTTTSQGTPLLHSEAEFSFEDRVECKESKRETREHLGTYLKQEC